MGGGSSTNPETPKKTGHGGKQRGKRKIGIRELKAQMAMICEEQNRLREGQREVQQKFQEIESKFSKMREQGNSSLFF
ncbi:hypothetical protein V6N13_136895 [Hibiscus sabdariffa]|uniref:Uncharacterized protein n=1 Tax=Hibiscus sabdariffa TaxID=183260 RepID=A0ABR2DM86_9ROSI